MNYQILQTYILPTWLACPLINGDYSAPNDDEITELENWIERVKPGICVGADTENHYLTHGNDFNRNTGDDVCEFTFNVL